MEHETAIIGILGAIIVALISGGFGFWIARGKERADAAAERRKHDVEVRRAARLIDADLQWARAAARMCVENKKWWLSDRALPTEGWRQYRGVIASELPEDAWTALIVAIVATDHLQSARDTAASIHRAKMATDPGTAAIVAAAKTLDLAALITEPTTIPDDTVTQIKPMLADIEVGRAALAPLTHDA